MTNVVGKRFRLIDNFAAHAEGLDGWYDDECRGLFDVKVGEVIALDGGEPEDMSFTRNLAWVPRLLNQLQDEIDTLNQTVESLRVQLQEAYDDLGDWNVEQ